MKNNFIFLIKETWNKAKAYFVITVIKNIIGAMVPMIDIIGIGQVVEMLTTNQEYQKVVATILIYVAINLVVSLVNVILTAVENGVMRKSTNVLQFGYMKDCVNVDYHFVQDRTLLDLKPKSMRARPEFFLGLWGRCISDISKIAGVITIMAVMSPWFLLALVLLAVCVIKTKVWTEKKETEYQQEKTEADRKMDYLYTAMTDYKYAKEIRINNVARILGDKYDEIGALQLRKLKQLIARKIGIESIGKILEGIQILLIYFYFTYQVFCGGISIAEYTVLVSSVTLCLQSAISLWSNLGYVKNNFSAIEYLKQYMTVVKENSINSDSNRFPLADMDFERADITFEKVSFHYPGTEQKILDNVSFSINAREKTALVGLNGAGKSTLIMLILRLYRPTEGRILMNGVDINTIPFDEYSKRFGVVLQDFSLFAYSVRENITFGEEVNEEKLEEVLKKSGLHDKIASLPKEANTAIYKDLDDEGIEFSGGDSQKLALARALYKNGSIVILDEPTSAFDPLAEYDFFKRLEELSEGKTTLFVSHRLSSTVFCHKILVLKNGKITEEGTHTELMERDGDYKELFMLQAQYYEKGVAYE
ncbi:MAG: ABC transporter ATP-binding protein [Lachnospiraceae bacterium]|nr:ABC transporter ATP-binding protein [Lachnospiraceae bacterium]